LLANKDQDFGVREGDNWNGNGSRTEKKSASPGALDFLENTVRKRLQVKQSIDHALNLRKRYASLPPLLPQPNLHLHWVNTPSTLLLPDQISTPTMRHQEDGPLYPHIYDDLPAPSPSSSRRPKSAEQSPKLKPEPLHFPSVPRKLGSIYSLLNLTIFNIRFVHLCSKLSC
jgi:hypothetical protein